MALTMRANTKSGVEEFLSFYAHKSIADTPPENIELGTPQTKSIAS